jgi:hypothetical protein
VPLENKGKRGASLGFDRCLGDCCLASLWVRLARRVSECLAGLQLFPQLKRLVNLILVDVTVQIMGVSYEWPRSTLQRAPKIKASSGAPASPDVVPPKIEQLLVDKPLVAIII